MMRKLCGSALNRGGIVVVLALALVIAGGAAGISLAQVGGSDEIHGCVLDASGLLRVVSDPAECRNNETPLSWSSGQPTGSGAPVFDTGLAPNCAISITPAPCLSKQLPAGSWLVTYRGVGEGAFGILNNANLACDLVVDGAVVDSYAGRSLANGAVVVLASAVAVASPATVEVACSAAPTPVPITLESQRMFAVGASLVSPW